MPNFAFSGGVTTIPGYGQEDTFIFTQRWNNASTWTISATSTNEGDFTLGKGRIAGISMAALKTLANRAFLAAGSSFYFCDNVDPVEGNGPIEWEEQGPGAGQIPFVSQYGAQDSVVGFASQQGRLAIFGRYSIQVWSIDSDPANFSRIQVLGNIGCRSVNSIQQLGDYDVLFLDDSGLRSLRSKEVTLNADPIDIGSAIDSLVTAKASSFTSACAVVEPTSKRYWCFISDTIFVLSYFRSNKIVAWSTYLPTYNVNTVFLPFSDHYASDGTTTYVNLTSGNAYTWTKGANDTSITVNGTTYTVTTTFAYDGSSTVTGTGTANALVTASLVEKTQTAFTPEKFIVYNGIVYIRTSTGLLLHYTEASYDSTVATVVTPYMDDKRPAEEKAGQAIDVAMSGAWTIKVGTDPATDNYQDAYISGSLTTPSMKIDSSFDYMRVGFSALSTHFAFKAVSSAACLQKCTLGALHYHYNRAGQE